MQKTLGQYLLDRRDECIRRAVALRDVKGVSTFWENAAKGFVLRLRRYTLEQLNQKVNEFYMEGVCA